MYIHYYLLSKLCFRKQDEYTTDMFDVSLEMKERVTSWWSLPTSIITALHCCLNMVRYSLEHTTLFCFFLDKCEVCWCHMCKVKIVKVKEYIWKWKSVYGSERVYMEVNECIWKWKSVYESEWVYMEVKECIWKWKSVNGSERMYMEVKECIWKWKSVYVS